MWRAPVCEKWDMRLIQDRTTPARLVDRARRNALAKLADAGRVLALKDSALLPVLTLLLLLSPSIWAVGYYGLLASDRFVSQATFVVRSANRTSVDGFAAFLRMVGVSSSQDDTFSVHDFMTSRDAIAKLQKTLDLRGIYHPPGADRIARYPNRIHGESDDEFHRYLKGRISVFFNHNTGISTLEVQAFAAEDAQRIASLLLKLSEEVINRMNQRIHEDTVRFANEEVQLHESRLRAIQLAITEFRNREIQIDPNRSSVLVMELVAKIMTELSRVSVQIAETKASSPDSPLLASLERRKSALEEQIAVEQGRVTDSSDGLGAKIVKFEGLNLERELAAKALASAIASLDGARAEARRQQLYLERISGPTLPDKAAMPQRAFEMISLVVVNLIVLLVGWLIRTGIAEHAPKIDHGCQ